MRPALAALALATLLIPGAAGVAEEKAPATEPAGRLAQREDPGVALTEGVRWLVEHQNADGSWGTHRTGRPGGIWCDVPGGHLAFRTATSAMATLALRGLHPDRRTEATEGAAARGLAFLVKTGAVKRSQPAQIYNVWSLGYSLRALAEALLAPRKGDDPDAMKAAAREIVAELAVDQAVDGGWGYFDFNHRTYNPSGSSMSFTTATCMIALHRAKEAGIAVPERMIRKGIACLKLCRNPDGSWIYSTDHRNWRRGLINRPKGSLSRTPACAWALNLFTGKPGPTEIEKGLAWLVEHHRFAWAGVREPTPHRSWYSVSGYFYLYGYAYAAFAIDLIPEERRSAYRDPLISAVLRTRYPDGSFWDYPLYDYHKAYGTAYAVIALDRLLRIPAMPETK